MDPIRNLDAALLLIVTIHTIIMLNRDEAFAWKHFIGRSLLAGMGFFAMAAAMDRLANLSPASLDSWTRLGFDAAVAAFITVRVWWPAATPSLEIYNTRL